MRHLPFWPAHQTSLSGGTVTLLLIIGLSACAPGGTAAQATAFPGHHIAPQGPVCDGALVPSDPVSPGTLYAFHFVGGDPTGVSQGQLTLSALDTRTGAQRWQEPVLGQPTLVGGILYTAGGSAGDSTGMQALDANTGKTLWTHAGLAGAGGSSSFPPVLANGIAYIGTSQNGPGQSGVYALRASDGTLLWSYPATNTNFSPFTVDDGMIYVTAWTSANAAEPVVTILALRAGAGTLLWQYSFHDGIPTGPAQVANGMIYFSMTQNTNPQGGVVGALRGSDGSLAWSQPVTGRPHIFALTGQTVYVAFGPDPMNAGVEAFGAIDGTILWKNPQQIFPFPVLADGVIYGNGPRPGQTIALDASSGKALWQASGAFPSSTSEPVEENGAVYTIGNGINALRASDGKLLWTHPATCQFPSQHPLLAIGNTVYYAYHYVQAIGKEAYHVYALRAADGKALW